MTRSSGRTGALPRNNKRSKRNKTDDVLTQEITILTPTNFSISGNVGLRKIQEQLYSSKHISGITRDRRLLNDINVQQSYYINLERDTPNILDKIVKNKIVSGKTIVMTSENENESLLLGVNRGESLYCNTGKFSEKFQGIKGQILNTSSLENDGGNVYIHGPSYLHSLSIEEYNSSKTHLVNYGSNKQIKIYIGEVSVGSSSTLYISGRVYISSLNNSGTVIVNSGSELIIDNVINNDSGSIRVHGLMDYGLTEELIDHSSSFKCIDFINEGSLELLGVFGENMTNEIYQLYDSSIDMPVNFYANSFRNEATGVINATNLHGSIIDLVNENNSDGQVISITKDARIENRLDTIDIIEIDNIIPVTLVPNAVNNDQGSVVLSQSSKLFQYRFPFTLNEEYQGIEDTSIELDVDTGSTNDNILNLEIYVVDSDDGAKIQSAIINSTVVSKIKLDGVLTNDTMTFTSVLPILIPSGENPIYDGSTGSHTISLSTILKSSVISVQFEEEDNVQNGRFILVNDKLKDEIQNVLQLSNLSINTELVIHNVTISQEEKLGCPKEEIRLHQQYFLKNNLLENYQTTLHNLTTIDERLNYITKGALFKCLSLTGYVSNITLYATDLYVKSVLPYYNGDNKNVGLDLEYEKDKDKIVSALSDANVEWAYVAKTGYIATPYEINEVDKKVHLTDIEVTLTEGEHFSIKDHIYSKIEEEGSISIKQDGSTNFIPVTNVDDTSVIIDGVKYHMFIELVGTNCLEDTFGVKDFSQEMNDGNLEWKKRLYSSRISNTHYAYNRGHNRENPENISLHRGFDYSKANDINKNVKGVKTFYDYVGLRNNYNAIWRPPPLEYTTPSNDNGPWTKYDQLVQDAELINNVETTRANVHPSNPDYRLVVPYGLYYKLDRFERVHAEIIKNWQTNIQNNVIHDLKGIFKDPDISGNYYVPESDIKFYKKRAVEERENETRLAKERRRPIENSTRLRGYPYYEHMSNNYSDTIFYCDTDESSKTLLHRHPWEGPFSFMNDYSVGYTLDRRMDNVEYKLFDVANLTSSLTVDEVVENYPSAFLDTTLHEKTTYIDLEHVPSGDVNIRSVAWRNQVGKPTNNRNKNSIYRDAENFTSPDFGPEHTDDLFNIDGVTKDITMSNRSGLSHIYLENDSYTTKTFYYRVLLVRPLDIIDYGVERSITKIIDSYNVDAIDTNGNEYPQWDHYLNTGSVNAQFKANPIMHFAGTCLFPPKKFLYSKHTNVDRLGCLRYTHSDEPLFYRSKDIGKITIQSESRSNDIRITSYNGFSMTNGKRDEKLFKYHVPYGPNSKKLHENLYILINPNEATREFINSKNVSFEEERRVVGESEKSNDFTTQNYSCDVQEYNISYLTLTNIKTGELHSDLTNFNLVSSVSNKNSILPNINEVSGKYYNLNSRPKNTRQKFIVVEEDGSNRDFHETQLDQYYYVDHDGYELISDDKPYFVSQYKLPSYSSTTYVFGDELSNAFKGYSSYRDGSFYEYLPLASRIFHSEARRIPSTYDGTENNTEHREIKYALSVNNDSDIKDRYFTNKPLYNYTERSIGHFKKTTSEDDNFKLGVYNGNIILQTNSEHITYINNIKSAIYNSLIEKGIVEEGSVMPDNFGSFTFPIQVIYKDINNDNEIMEEYSLSSFISLLTNSIFVSIYNTPFNYVEFMLREREGLSEGYQIFDRENLPYKKGLFVCDGFFTHCIDRSEIGTKNVPLRKKHIKLKEYVLPSGKKYKIRDIGRNYTGSWNRNHKQYTITEEGYNEMFKMVDSEDVVTMKEEVINMIGDCNYKFTYDSEDILPNVFIGNVLIPTIETGTPYFKTYDEFDDENTKSTVNLIDSNNDNNRLLTYIPKNLSATLKQIYNEDTSSYQAEKAININIPEIEIMNIYNDLDLYNNVKYQIDISVPAFDEIQIDGTTYIDCSKNFGVEYSYLDIYNDNNLSITLQPNCYPASWDEWSVLQENPIEISIVAKYGDLQAILAYSIPIIFSPKQMYWSGLQDVIHHRSLLLVNEVLYKQIEINAGEMNELTFIDTLVNNVEFDTIQLEIEPQNSRVPIKGTFYEGSTMEDAVKINAIVQDGVQKIVHNINSDKIFYKSNFTGDRDFIRLVAKSLGISSERNTHSVNVELTPIFDQLAWDMKPNVTVDIINDIVTEYKYGDDIPITVSITNIDAGGELMLELWDGVTDKGTYTINYHGIDSDTFTTDTILTTSNNASIIVTTTETSTLASKHIFTIILHITDDIHKKVTDKDRISDGTFKIVYNKDTINYLSNDYSISNGIDIKLSGYVPVFRNQNLEVDIGRIYKNDSITIDFNNEVITYSQVQEIVVTEVIKPFILNTKPINPDEQEVQYNITSIDDITSISGLENGFISTDLYTFTFNTDGSVGPIEIMRAKVRDPLVNDGVISDYSEFGANLIRLIGLDYKFECVTTPETTTIMYSQLLHQDTFTLGFINSEDAILTTPEYEIESIRGSQNSSLFPTMSNRRRKTNTISEPKLEAEINEDVDGTKLIQLKKINDITLLDITDTIEKYQLSVKLTYKNNNKVTSQRIIIRGSIVVDGTYSVYDNVTVNDVITMNNYVVHPTGIIISSVGNDIKQLTNTLTDFTQENELLQSERFNTFITNVRNDMIDGNVESTETDAQFSDVFTTINFREEIEAIEQENITKIQNEGIENAIELSEKNNNVKRTINKLRMNVIKAALDTNPNLETMKSTGSELGLKTRGEIDNIVTIKRADENVPLVLDPEQENEVYIVFNTFEKQFVRDSVDEHRTVLIEKTFNGEYEYYTIRANYDLDTGSVYDITNHLDETIFNYIRKADGSIRQFKELERFSLPYMRNMITLGSIHISSTEDGDGTFYVDVENLEIGDEVIWLVTSTVVIRISYVNHDSINQYKFTVEEGEMVKQTLYSEYPTVEYIVVGDETYVFIFNDENAANTGTTSGDPHIYPIYGNKYELPTTPGMYRLAQGKDINVNVSTRTITPKEKEDIENYYMMTQFERYPSNLMRDGVFYDKAYISSEGNTLLFDFNKGTCICKNNGYFRLSTTSNDTVNDNIYESSKKIQEMVIEWTHAKYGVLSVTMRYFKNPQIKYGIRFHAEHVKNLSGLVLHECDIEKMSLTTMNDTNKKTFIYKKQNPISFFKKNKKLI